MRCLWGVLALALLAGCGRVGPPRQPGPRNEIIYPRAYPMREPRPNQPPATPEPPVLTPLGPGGPGALVPDATSRQGY